MNNSIYCLKCKKKTDNKNYSETVAKNGKPIGKAICVICGSQKNTFLGHKIKK